MNCTKEMLMTADCNIRIARDYEKYAENARLKDYYLKIAHACYLSALVDMRRAGMWTKDGVNYLGNRRIP